MLAQMDDPMRIVVADVVIETIAVGARYLALEWDLDPGGAAAILESRLAES